MTLKTADNKSVVFFKFLLNFLKTCYGIGDSDYGFCEFRAHSVSSRFKF